MPLRLGRRLARAPQRAAAAAGDGFDTLVAMLTGTPARVRVALAPGLLVGRAPKVHFTVPGLRVGGLHLAGLDVRAGGVRVPVDWPPRLRAARVEVRVRVEQASLDAWIRSTRLPLRLALRPGVISARTGIGGRRLGEVDMALRLDEGRLLLAARRVSMFGVAVHPGAVMPPVTLPLPALPRHARLVAVDPNDGAVDLAFELADLDERVTAGRLRWALAALRGTDVSVFDRAGRSVPELRLPRTATTGGALPQASSRFLEPEAIRPAAIADLGVRSHGG